jgi:CubicO group peptidase (beta-lactamase class C family)
MPLRKIILRTIYTLLLLALTIGIRYAWRAMPIISGFGAKIMASSVYLQHRNPDDVLKQELAFFPITLGSFTVNREDSSVTGSVWGLAKRKAIYRTGIGCTLVNEYSEDSIRHQHFSIPPAPVQNTDTIAWPYGDKTTDSLPANINKALLQQAIDNTIQAKSKNGKPGLTRAVLVVYDGQLIGEQYALGFNKQTVQIGWSMTKSLTAAMIGVLVQQGKLNVNAPAPVPEWAGTPKQTITLKNILQQSTGLDFIEDYNNPSEATNMLFKRADMGGYTASLSLKYTPGSQWYYSSGNANILSRIIRQTVGDAGYSSFPYQSLFHKINMYSLVLEPDASGTYVGSSYSYATARDFARFGLLYYNNGKWKGEQLLPENWVKESIQPASSDTLHHYGYQLWLNGYPGKDSTHHLFPDVPNDLYFADGWGGQNIYIIPSKKLIVVRLGVRTIDDNLLLKEIIQSIQ